MFKRMRGWLWRGLWLGLAAASGVAAEPLTYEPVALGWTAEEVEQSASGQLIGIVQRAQERRSLGCSTHCARLNRLFADLVVQARGQSLRAYALPWTLTVVRLEDVEALALPGGQVLISEPFIDREVGADDAALAFVLAHEMSHSILEHERQALTFARLLLPRQVPRSVQDMYVEMDFNLGLLRAMAPALQQGEFEADELGLLLAAAAGHRPDRQLAFLDHEASEANTTPPPPVVATHPALPERLARLRALLPLAWRVWAAAHPAP